MNKITISALDHINMYVTDIHQTISFYEVNFGFSIKENGLDDESPWAIIGIQDVAYLAIYQTDKLSNVNKINHWGFSLDPSENIESAIDKLRFNNVHILYDTPPDNGIVNWPRSKSIYIIDPDGYEIEISSSFGGNLQ